MSVYGTFIGILAPVTYICVLFLRWFALEFIYNEPQSMWSGSFLTIAVATILIVLLSIIAFFISRPFDNLVRKIRQEDYVATKDDIEIGCRCYKHLINLTMIGNFVGFFVGQVILVYLGIAQGRVVPIPIRMFLIIAQAMGFGFISFTATANGLDLGLTKYRALLKIQDFHTFKKYKSMDISGSIIFTVISCTYFFSINMIAAPYGLLQNLEEGLISGFTTKQMLFRVLSCVLQSLLLCSYPFFKAVTGLSSRIRTTSTLIEDIAVKGDLTTRIDITLTDDFGMLTSSINTMISKLSYMIMELRKGTGNVSDSANVIVESAGSASSALVNMASKLEKIAQNSTNQTSLIYEADESISTLVANVENVKQHIAAQTEAMSAISSSITEMSASINSVAEISTKAQSVSQELTASSHKGTAAVELAVKTMKEIKDAFEDVQTSIAVIQDISEKTDLLSMNAAIEAAHAGDVGKGFAVVADEVNTLAASSSESASMIQTKIDEMLLKISAGVEAISSAGELFAVIANRVDQNEQLVKSIYEAMEEQRVGAMETRDAAEEIMASVQEVKELTVVENEQAESLREFMLTVVNASTETEEAVQESLSATEDLQNTIKLVDESATGNQSFVNTISDQVNQFHVDEE